MPDRKAESKDTPKIEFDALPEKVVPDPNQPADVVVLRGFVGRSALEGSVRLYNRQFDRYVEIQVSDILHQQKLSTSQSALGGSIVYVKANAPLQRVQSKKNEAQFLEGDITSAFAGSGARASLMRGALGARYRLYTLAGWRCKSNAATSCSDVCATRGCGGGGEITGILDCFTDDCDDD